MARGPLVFLSEQKQGVVGCGEGVMYLTSLILT